MYWFHNAFGLCFSAQKTPQCGTKIACKARRSTLHFLPSCDWAAKATWLSSIKNLEWWWEASAHWFCTNMHYWRERYLDQFLHILASPYLGCFWCWHWFQVRLQLRSCQRSMIKIESQPWSVSMLLVDGVKQWFWTSSRHLSKKRINMASVFDINIQYVDPLFWEVSWACSLLLGHWSLARHLWMRIVCLTGFAIVWLFFYHQSLLANAHSSFWTLIVHIPLLLAISCSMNSMLTLLWFLDVRGFSLIWMMCSAMCNSFSWCFLGLTSILQPLDRCINGPIEKLMVGFWSVWFEGQESSGDYLARTKGGNLRSPPQGTVLGWLADSITSLSSNRGDLLSRAFKYCGITNNLDGTEYDMIYEQPETEENASKNSRIDDDQDDDMMEVDVADQSSTQIGGGFSDNGAESQASSEDSDDMEVEGGSRQFFFMFSLSSSSSSSSSNSSSSSSSSSLTSVNTQPQS